MSFYWKLKQNNSNNLPPTISPNTKHELTLPSMAPFFTLHKPQRTFNAPKCPWDELQCQMLAALCGGLMQCPMLYGKPCKRPPITCLLGASKCHLPFIRDNHLQITSAPHMVSLSVFCCKIQACTEMGCRQHCVSLWPLCPNVIYQQDWPASFIWQILGTPLMLTSHLHIPNQQYFICLPWA